MKKVIIVMLIVGLLLGLAWGISARVKQQERTPQMREAKLYAIRVDETPVFKDSVGDLWEIDWLKEVTAEDSVLLEIVSGHVNRTWVQVEAVPETEIEG